MGTNIVQGLVTLITKKKFENGTFLRAQTYGPFALLVCLSNVHQMWGDAREVEPSRVPTHREWVGIIPSYCV